MIRRAFKEELLWRMWPGGCIKADKEDSILGKVKEDLPWGAKNQEPPRVQKPGTVPETISLSQQPQ